MTDDADLLPDVGRPDACFEVLVSVPLESPDGPLVPCVVPVIEGVSAVWMDERVIVGVTVDAADEGAAVLKAREVARRLTGLATAAEVTVRRTSGS